MLCSLCWEDCSAGVNRRNIDNKTAAIFYRDVLITEFSFSPTSEYICKKCAKRLDKIVKLGDNLRALRGEIETFLSLTSNGEKKKSAAIGISPKTPSCPLCGNSCSGSTSRRHIDSKTAVVKYRDLLIREFSFSPATVYICRKCAKKLYIIVQHKDSLKLLRGEIETFISLCSSREKKSAALSATPISNTHQNGKKINTRPSRLTRPHGPPIFRAIRPAVLPVPKADQSTLSQAEPEEEIFKGMRRIKPAVPEPDLHLSTTSQTLTIAPEQDVTSQCGLGLNYISGGPSSQPDTNNINPIVQAINGQCNVTNVIAEQMIVTNQLITPTFCTTTSRTEPTCSEYISVLENATKECIEKLSERTFYSLQLPSQSLSGTGSSGGVINDPPIELRHPDVSGTLRLNSVPYRVCEACKGYGFVESTVQDESSNSNTEGVRETVTNEGRSGNTSFDVDDEALDLSTHNAAGDPELSHSTNVTNTNLSNAAEAEQKELSGSTMDITQYSHELGEMVEEPVPESITMPTFDIILAPISCGQSSQQTLEQVPFLSNMLTCMDPKANVRFIASLHTYALPISNTAKRKRNSRPLMEHAPTSDVSDFVNEYWKDIQATMLHVYSSDSLQPEVADALEQLNSRLGFPRLVKGPPSDIFLSPNIVEHVSMQIQDIVKKARLANKAQSALADGQPNELIEDQSQRLPSESSSQQFQESEATAATVSKSSPCMSGTGNLIMMCCNSDSDESEVLDSDAETSVQEPHAQAHDPVDRSVPTVSGNIDIAMPVSTVTGNIDTAIAVSTVTGNMDTAMPVSTVTGNIDTAMPVSTVTGNIDTAMPVSTVTGNIDVAMLVPMVTENIDTAMPVSMVTGDIDAVMPVSTVTGNIDTATPISSVTGNMNTAMPVSTVTGNIDTAMPVSTVSGKINTAMPLSTITGNYDSVIPLTTVSRNDSRVIPVSILTVNVDGVILVSTVSGNENSAIPMSTIPGNEDSLMQDELATEVVESSKESKFPLWSDDDTDSEGVKDAKAARKDPDWSPPSVAGKVSCLSTSPSSSDTEVEESDEETDEEDRKRERRRLYQLEQRDKPPSGPRKNLKCAHCDYVTKQRHLLHAHERTVHDIHSSYRLACELCGKRVLTQNCINYHCATEHGMDLPYATHLCTTCGRHFGYRHTYMGHIRRCSHKQPVKCLYEGCNVMLSSMDARESHNSRIHLRKYEVVCPYKSCNRKFLANSQLRKHIDGKHLKLKPFSCTEEGCSKKFATGDSLTVHLRTHSSIPYLSCHYCNYACRQRNAMNWHMKKHPEALEDKVKE